jgi:hypothetical protein
LISVNVFFIFAIVLYLFRLCFVYHYVQCKKRELNGKVNAMKLFCLENNKYLFVQLVVCASYSIGFSLNSVVAAFTKIFLVVAYTDQILPLTIMKDSHHIGAIANFCSSSCTVSEANPRLQTKLVVNFPTKSITFYTVQRSFD